MKIKHIKVLSLVTSIAVGSMFCANAQTTEAEQKSMTPQQILKDLLAGNERYVSNELTSIKADIPASREITASGQYPKAVILSCLDSRVPVELVFDQKIGDVFVGRVAGNVENVDQIGSMEFATKLAGSKLIMVLGHSSCGAVKGACDGAELENLTALLAKIKPAVDAVASSEKGEKNSSNKDFVAKVVEQNVKMTVKDIRAKSNTLSTMEKEGNIMIVGAVYDLKTGKVSLVD